MTDVVVVGAGPVGTVLAGELERRGVAVRVLERRVTAGGGTRAIGLHAPVLAALEEDPALRVNWTGWFGIAAQWLPHWEPVPADAEYIGGRLSGEDVVK